MQRALILIVEDDPPLAELLRWHVSQAGYDVLATADGEDAVLLIEEERPDLVILDWMIENLSGIEVCRRIRRMGELSSLPVIMLTARSAEDDRLRGLETGADDYMTKPFSPAELILRVKAVLRRTRPAVSGEMLKVGSVTMDTSGYQCLGNIDLAEQSFTAALNCKEEMDLVVADGREMSSRKGAKLALKELKANKAQ